MPSPPRAITLMTLLTLALGGLTACSSDSATGPTAQKLAQNGLLQSYTASYAMAGADGTPSGTLTAWRTPSRLRLDVTTAAGVATSITTPEGTVACQKKAAGGATTCLNVAGPATTPPANFDPVLRKVFGDVLRVLAAEDNGLQVTRTEPTETPSPYPTSTPSGINDVRCFVVNGPTDSIVAKGTYCFDANGVPVSLIFESGSATLTAFTSGAPAGTSFAPPAVPTPLPEVAS